MEFTLLWAIAILQKYFVFLSSYFNHCIFDLCPQSSLEYIVEDIAKPWMCGGSFSVILHAEEKLGGLFVTHQETTNFAQCLHTCNMKKIDFTGSTYTWWNGRIEHENLFKKLDWAVVNDKFLQFFPNSEVQHLERSGSDHSPLHVICKDNREAYAKPFRFLNFWVNHPKFKETMRRSWEENVDGSPFYIVQQKLKG